MCTHATTLNTLAQVAEQASAKLSEAMEERDSAIENLNTARAEAAALREEVDAAGARLQAAADAAATAEKQKVTLVLPCIISSLFFFLTREE